MQYDFVCSGTHIVAGDLGGKQFFRRGSYEWAHEQPCQAFVSEYEQRVSCIRSTLAKYDAGGDDGAPDGAPDGLAGGAAAPKKKEAVRNDGYRLSQQRMRDRAVYDDLGGDTAISVGANAAVGNFVRNRLKPVDFTNDALEKYGDSLVGFTLTSLALLQGVASENHDLTHYLGVSLTSDKNSSSNALLGEACRSSDFVNVYLSIPGDEDAAAVNERRGRGKATVPARITRADLIPLWRRMLGALTAKCWHQQPSMRPAFAEIKETLQRITVLFESQSGGDAPPSTSAKVAPAETMAPPAASRAGGDGSASVSVVSV